MITVFGGFPTRAFRVAWALEELGLAYHLHSVDLRNRSADAELQKRNPAGFLPVLDDDGVVMVESIAIIEYLIARYDENRLAPAAADPGFPVYQQFLHLGEAGLAAYLNVVVASKFFAPEGEKQNWGAKIAERMFFNRLTLVAQRLGEAPMLAGDSFTAADISVTYALDLADRLGLGERFTPEVQDYRARMSARPAYQVTKEKLPPPGVA
ncbi:MAG TPA: glutathione S-transferase family protein [Rhizomicrobium sp.]|jgi:glutathione S-transferase|nr:glutathione S-transferase family protein [Rhizomicrobium sp.]